MKKDSMLYVVLFTFIVCAAFVLVLAVANEGTKDLVAANKEFATQSAVLGAFGIPFSGQADAAAKYASEIRRGDAGGYASWAATIDGTDYVAVEQSGAGLWGTISVILAATPDAGRVRGIRVVAQNETPGLGGRIEEAWFLGQYEGEKTTGGAISMKAGAESSGKADADKENGRVDGISGATRTSQSFGAIVDAGLARVKATGGSR
ncbi:MAG: FMN-binding protein [Spirochaetae bacterium HGW-Spirochaetae-3]|jgi:Na+-transporting NADH:ubiquinone oxidoreductase subunit C|nr:MAG: FMN-binding protein [Spirochaetae bacterium HGW-Spirochaetae-3]